ncbi:MAG TPA: uroporphyrinogen-III synthase, partial [Syntrophorhabdaceae bacterium]|nr:uroporphyrinogen-III synthase [Syntrophorhabdaceae bacterium]
IFTSTNSVNIFFNTLFENKKDIRALNNIKVFAIGEATANALVAKGVLCDFLPERWTSEGIVDILKTLNIKNKHLLLPRAEDARDIIVEYINNHGGICHVIPIYRTVLPKKVEELKERPDVITFTSSSTVKNFITLYGKAPLESALVASIGPITTETLKSHGIGVNIEAKRHDIPGLIEAIEAHFKNRK